MSEYKCEACDTPFTFPEGQYTRNCPGCGMKIVRELTKEEVEKKFDCSVCDGTGCLPMISVEVTASDKSGEPVLRYGLPCVSCPAGMRGRQNGAGKAYPSLALLPHRGEYDRYKSCMKYHQFIEDKFDEMQERHVKARRVMRAVELAKKRRKPCR